MRKLLFAIGTVLAFSATAATAQVSVRGYVRKDGTYVAPHVRSAPNSSRLDNYSTKGNVNPYTGREGTVDPYSSPQPTYRSYNSTPSYPRPTYQAPSYSSPFSTPKRCTNVFGC